MSIVSTILEASPDGTLHLPVPPNLRGIRVRVEARLEAARPETDKTEGLRSIMREIRKRNPFGSIVDPVAWQRETREDVMLPGRS